MSLPPLARQEASRYTLGFPVRAGAGKRDAVGRVFALGFLEYAALGIGALVASALLYLRLDGHASNAITLPSLMIIPCFASAIWVTSPKRLARLADEAGHADQDRFRERGGRRRERAQPYSQPP